MLIHINMCLESQSVVFDINIECLLEDKTSEKESQSNSKLAVDEEYSQGKVIESDNEGESEETC